MKKYQKMIKDNMDLISEAEDSLFYDIEHSEENDANVSDGYLRSIYISSGALQMIDENYDYSQIPSGVVSAFANMIFAYASCAYEGKMSHDYKMHCFEVSRQIKDNLHWHRMREPMFNNS